MQRVGSRSKGTQRVGSRAKGTQRVGSRAQVMHGNAKQTGGGLKMKDLKTVYSLGRFSYYSLFKGGFN